ncbi:dnaJ homolog subfamily C member 24 [Periophthalmus magnuspinnatus]|uniref:dnaJ homolog subfamily C member 24 n=1 Tax=Periophthalmus magnuspinnatus TaxID=409849 RepID=UPI00145BE442|nr:dnaJ homolog subfamily C member 24 [Periophthalmus magnuspinnatus]
MCASSSEKDLYGVLGASPSESTEELRRRYQHLVLKCHPDRLSGHETEVGLKRFLEVDAAWKILSDKNKRRDYDLQRRARDLKQDWPVDSTVFLEDMAWNNDERLYTHCCRCGGAFIIDEEEVQEETLRSSSQEEAETAGGQSRGVIVCCDTCSLSVYVTWTNPPQS